MQYDSIFSTCIAVSYETTYKYIQLLTFLMLNALQIYTCNLLKKDSFKILRNM